MALRSSVNPLTAFSLPHQCGKRPDQSELFTNIYHWLGLSELPSDQRMT